MLTKKNKRKNTEWARAQNAHSSHYLQTKLERQTAQHNDGRTINLAFFFSFFKSGTVYCMKRGQSESVAWAWKWGERDWFAETKSSILFLRTLPDMTLPRVRCTKAATPPVFPPIVLSFAKTQDFFFLFTATHSLHSCLPWFLTTFPTLCTGSSTSCIRFTFFFFFAQSFAILNKNKRARLRGRISRDHAYHRRWEYGRREGEKNKIWLSFQKTRWSGTPWVVICPGQTEPTGWGFGTWKLERQY